MADEPVDDYSQEEDTDVNVFWFLRDKGFNEEQAFRIALHTLVTRIFIDPAEVRSAAMELGFMVPLDYDPLTLRMKN